MTARDILRIVRPPAAPTATTPFKGRIESIGIGPAGIVAQVHSHLDWDAWVASKLGANDWVSRYKGVDFKNGILEITMKPGQGRGLKVVWADQGFEPGDYQDAGFGWYSPDGEQWTLMAPTRSPDGGRWSRVPDRLRRASWACRTASSRAGRTPRTRAPARMAAAGCGTHRTV